MAKLTIVAQRNLSKQYRRAARDAQREAEAVYWTEGLVRCPDEIHTRVERELLAVERALRIQLALR